MGNYLHSHNKRGLRKEYTFRCGKSGGTQTTPTVLSATDVLMFDRINEDKFELPIPKLKREKTYEFGDGRNGSGQKYLGYEAEEKDIPMDLQTAMFLMYGLGSCVTTGTQVPTNGTFTGFASTTIVVTAASGDYTYARNALVGIPVILTGATTVQTYITASAATTASTLTLTLAAASPATGANTCQFFGTDPGTDVMASGQGTASITMTTAVTCAVSQLVGKTVIINSVKYVIISQAAKTNAVLVLGLDKATGASDDGQTVTFYTYPYTHTISEANTLYSFVFHDELKDSSPSATFDVLREYYGCIVKKVVIHLEPGQAVTCTATVMVGSYQEATTSGSNVNAQTSFPEPFDDSTAKIFTFDMLDAADTTNCYVKYNGTAIETGQTFWNEVGAIDITIENTDLSYSNVNGDKFPYKKIEKGREYTIKFTGYKPTNNTLYLLRNKELTEYAGAITAKFRLSRDKTRDDDYIDITFDNLQLVDYPDVMVNVKEGQKAIDFELQNAPKYIDTSNVSHAVGTCAIVALDKLDKRYYEDIS